jgi:hypothetical protein
MILNDGNVLIFKYTRTWSIHLCQLHAAISLILKPRTFTIVQINCEAFRAIFSSRERVRNYGRRTGATFNADFATLLISSTKISDIAPTRHGISLWPKRTRSFPRSENIPCEKRTPKSGFFQGSMEKR